MLARKIPVALYYPNLVGYFRVFLLLYTLYIALEQPILASIFFILNTLLDACDGYLARSFDQSSQFGAMLDYATDRSAVASFFVLLGHVYPEYLLLFCFLVTLDISSHLFHIKSSHLQNLSSHKNVGLSEPLVLRLYYNRAVLSMSCLTHDLFLTFVFLYKFYPTQEIFLCMISVLPGFLFKILVHLVQTVRSSNIMLRINQRDKQDVGL